MISPLAFVCMFLPNTEKWFTTWKKTLTSMLFFYPMFAALFGACSLIGWVIIAAAETPLLLVLGIAVKVIPLFLSWKLLKMSGTLPGQISAGLSNFAKIPLGATSRYFMSHSALSRARYLGGTTKPYQNSRRLAQYLEDRHNRREIDTKKYIEASKLRGLGFASDYRDIYGNYTRRGERLDALASQNARSQTQVAIGDNELEAGFDPNRAKNRRQARRIDALNADAIRSFEALKWETTAHSQKIKHDNAQAYLARTNQAINAHIKSSVRGEALDAADLANLEIYNRMLDTMNGDHEAVHYIEAGAATEALVQQKIVSKQFTDYFSTLPPTQNVHDRLKDLTNYHHSSDYIEPIIAGMRILNQRGDTDLVYDVVQRTVQGGQLRLGTHASQSLANFCMFETKDSDFTLRRFGKYINLETARVFNDGVSDADRRRNDVFDFTEYVTGKFTNYDADGNIIEGTSKLSLAPLLKGTSIDGIERTSFAVLDQALYDAYGTDTESLRSTRRTVFNNMIAALIGGGLKFPSGSEQLENEATWITGLKNKKGKWHKTWLDPDSPLAGLTEADFLKNAQDFLAAQTPSQIFSLRTDLFGPIIELLADDYESSLTGSEKDAFDALRADAEANPDDKDKQRAFQEAREKGAKQGFRKLLHEKGKLGQILLTRSAGGANNAKDKLRDFLGLDDDAFVNEYLEKYRPENEGKRKKKGKKGGADPNDAHVDTGIYDASDRDYFQTLVTELYMTGPDSPTFADEALDIIRKNIGKSSYLSSLFEAHLKSNPTASNADLLSELYSLLSDPSNY